MESQPPDRNPAERAPAPPPPAPGPEMPSSPVPPRAMTAGGRPGSGPPSPDYPVRFEVDRQESYSRLLPFVKWLLAIPHYLVLIFLYIGVFFAAIAAFFAVLITGKFPPGILTFVEGTVRWTYRTTAYAMLMTDTYPPFSLDEDPNHPVRLTIAQPDKIARWRPLVHWLLVIPYYVIAYILQLIWVYLVVIISFFAIVITGKYPQALFDFSLVQHRWNLRSGAYFFFVTEKYPPFVYA